MVLETILYICGALKVLDVVICYKQAVIRHQNLGKLQYIYHYPSRLHAAIFDGLENTALICIDDVDQIAGDTILEEQLFHFFFNRVRANGHRLIIFADVPPTQLAIKLPDLKSRLSWGVVYQLHTLIR